MNYYEKYLKYKKKYLNLLQLGGEKCTYEKINNVVSYKTLANKLKQITPNNIGSLNTIDDSLFNMIDDFMKSDARDLKEKKSIRTIANTKNIRFLNEYTSVCNKLVDRQKTRDEINTIISTEAKRLADELAAEEAKRLADELAAKEAKRLADELAAKEAMLNILRPKCDARRITRAKLFHVATDAEKLLDIECENNNMSTLKK